jgi:putative SOS response-associated peptidase YedK
MKLNLDRLKDPSLKIPVGLDRYFVLSQDPSESRLAGPIRQFYEEEKTRVQAEIKLVENEIREFSSSKPTAAIKKKVETRERKLEKLRRKLEFSFDRISPLDERIFPGYFAPVILNRGEKRVIVPMRYRVRRPDGGEVPYQYNVFNARRDSLLTAPTWKPLFGQSHAIFPFTKFFEWVEREDKKREISFVPESRTMMWAAALYSEPQDKSYRSFAMVTDEPPPEVAEAGHDRCPIFLSEEHIDAWLEPKGKSKEYLLSLLDHKEKTYYSHSLVA